MTFLGLKQESVAQGEAHKALARDLEQFVLEPFQGWAEGHASRITDSKLTLLDERLKIYEDAVARVTKLQETYQAKVRKADELEDQ